MSTDTDRVGYQTRTLALPASIGSGHGDVRFLRLIRFTCPASPLTIVQYALKGQEQELGLRLDLDKMAFLDHYADDSEVERTAARAIVTYLSKGASAGHFAD
jgi:hypothetical protein